MLKNLGYDGAYHDPNISVNVLLENPLDYGLDAATLVFSVTIKDKRERADNLNIENFDFYIMDEQNRLYNAHRMPDLQPSAKAIPEDDEPVCQPDTLILTDLKYEFLFQDLRVAFYYRPDHQIKIIELRH